MESKIKFLKGKILCNVLQVFSQQYYLVVLHFKFRPELFSIFFSQFKNENNKLKDCNYSIFRCLPKIILLLARCFLYNRADVEARKENTIVY